MTSQPLPPKRIFPSSKVDARSAEHVPSAPQTESPAYKLAFQDSEFLLREDLRPVRFQLELLKPELLLNEADIGSTFVFYGSARIPSPEMADALIAAATNPAQEKIAERLKAKSHYYDIARELLTLIQTGKVRPLPILLFGKEFWNRVIDFEGLVEEGVIAPHDLDLIHWTEDANEAWDFVRNYYADHPAAPLMQSGPPE